ncbi:hypothetical protein AB0L74_14080 [Streptomyces sp. NPDC052020]|uniref:hypothetical protein n=1 Tax=Streptomyces sp. NPDC052020 TaxID=3155677 RepID=UPI003417453E
MNQRRSNRRGGRKRSSSIRGGKTSKRQVRPETILETPPAATPADTETESESS